MNRIPVFSGLDPFYEEPGPGRGIYPAVRIKQRRGIRKWLYPLYRSFNLALRTQCFQEPYLSGLKGTVLDLGCGSGNQWFTRIGPVTGVDISQAALENAREIYEQVIQSDGYRLPFEEGVFDVIICNHILEHIDLDKKGQVIEELFRILKNGGRLVGLIPVLGNNIFHTFAKKYPELLHREWVVGFGHRGLESARENLDRLKQAGFFIETVRKLYTVIWPAGIYALNFNNGFREKSCLIAAVVAWDRMVLKLGSPFNHFGNKVFNCLLGIASGIIDRSRPLEQAVAINIACRKP